jgi:hypothetical protein
VTPFSLRATCLGMSFCFLPQPARGLSSHQYPEFVPCAVGVAYVAIGTLSAIGAGVGIAAFAPTGSATGETPGDATQEKAREIVSPVVAPGMDKTVAGRARPSIQLE